MDGFLLDAATFLLRWLHVVAAIAWIGESFYFVMLDRTLLPPKQPLPGLHGEAWSVHGGGFYHKQKYLPAPAELPAVLHWSMWKSYTTWLSGFVLLSTLYFAAPSVYLLDPAVSSLGPVSGVAAAIGLLVAGWLAYDLMCRLIGFRDRALGVAVALLVVAVAVLATQLFAGRAAFLLTGAVLATIMSANVFFVIIPGQRRMVAALARGEAPDPLPGRQGKQRSVHNTYFTLPVVFAMLSVHYPAAWAHPQNWAMLLLFMAAGALIRQFFVLWHSGGRAWGLLGGGALLIVVALAWMAPAARPAAGSAAGDGGSAPSASAAVDDGAVPTTADILPLLTRHCTSCHSAQPRLMPSAPKGVMFDTATDAERHAAAVRQQTHVLRIMPPGNLTGMQDAERERLRRWADSLLR